MKKCKKIKTYFEKILEYNINIGGIIREKAVSNLTHITDSSSHFMW